MIFSISILKWNPKKMDNPIFMCSVNDLSSFGFFEKMSVKEFIIFISRETMKKTVPGNKQIIEDNEFTIHSYLRSDFIGAVVITSKEYKPRIAVYLMNNLLEQFTKNIDHAKYDSDCNLKFEQLDEAIVKYQKQEEVDRITKIQKELDETIEIIHKTIESVLDRGEKLETLVDKSSDLSMHSKMFYNTARTQNKCCVIS